MIRNLPFWAVLFLTVGLTDTRADGTAERSDTSLGVVAQDGTYRVEIRSDGRTLMASPPEGLWSIATDWQDAWAADWHHVGPSRMTREGEWTILEGKVDLPDGTWILRDAYRERGPVVQCVRRFEGCDGSARRDDVPLVDSRAIEL